MKKYVRVNGMLSDDDVRRLLETAIADCRMEGMEMKPCDMDMLEQYIRGNVTDDEYMDWVKREAGVM